jgi:hypothetical protein
MNDTDNAQLRNEIAVLKANGARRQDLSQHACKRLFFDFGVRPSMATVRELTQTGSASDIPKDIDSFWARIRAASRIRIEGGALPEALQERAGELLGQLFEEAQQLATASLAMDREMAAQEVANAMSRLRDAEVRCLAMEEALHRSEARADAATAGKSMLEAELALARSQQADIHGESKASVQRMEGDRAALVQRLEVEQAANAALRERVDTLNTELRHHTEHYAQQIKDAVTEAERRVKPMLVELDALRGMATTYQASVRDANQKEFEYMQQLSTAKARADRLDLLVRQQSDRLDALTLERDALVRHSGTNETVGRLIVAMVEAGRLSETEIAALGTNIDSFVNIPVRCPACETGEPELVQHENEFDLSCPDCERSSGAAASRLCAVSRFRGVAGPDSTAQAKR